MPDIRPVDGGRAYQIVHDDGTVEYEDAATGASLGYDAPPGSTPVAELSPEPPEGTAYLLGREGQPMTTRTGEYLLAPVPSGTSPQLLGGGVPAIDARTSALPTAPRPQPSTVAPAPGQPAATGPAQWAPGAEDAVRMAAGGAPANADPNAGPPGIAAFDDPGGSPPSTAAMPSNLPAYATGQAHPAAEGYLPNDAYQDSGAGGVPAPLPYVNNRTPALPGGGGGYSGGGASGGGGSDSLAKDLYWKFRNNVESSLMGYDSGWTNYPSFKYPEPEEYDPYADVKMTGEAKKFDPEQASSLYGRPSMLIPMLFPKLNPVGLGYKTLANMPVTNLAFLANARKRKWDGGINDFANAAIDVTKKLGKDNAPAANLTNANWLLRQLGGARGKDNGVVNQFKGQPIGTAIENYNALFQTATSMGNPVWEAGMNAYAQQLLDQYGSKALTRKTEKNKGLNRWMSRKIKRAFG